MFQLTARESKNLKFQFGTSKWGGRRYLPFVFTEQGVAMLSTVLNSERAISVNIAIMRTFVKIRQILFNHKELAHKLVQLERKIEGHDQKIQTLFDVMRQLLETPEKPKKRIGFHAEISGNKHPIRE